MSKFTHVHFLSLPMFAIAILLFRASAHANPVVVPKILENVNPAPTELHLPGGSSILRVGLLPAQDVQHPGVVALTCQIYEPPSAIVAGYTAVYTWDAAAFALKFSTQASSWGPNATVYDRISYRHDTLACTVTGSSNPGNNAIWTTRSPGDHFTGGVFGSLDRDTGNTYFHSPFQVSKPPPPFAAHTLLPVGSPAPPWAGELGAGGTTFVTFHQPQADQGHAAFFADLSVAARGVGVFTWTGGGPVVCVADFKKPLPQNTSFKFSNFQTHILSTSDTDRFYLSPACQAGRIAFYGEGISGTNSLNGIYTSLVDGTGLNRIADTNTDVPGLAAGQHFSGFGYQTATDGTLVAFVGAGPTGSGVTGIYVYCATTGKSNRVVDNSADFTFIKGKPIKFHLGPEALTGNRIVFGAEFANASGVPNDTGIYVMPVACTPPPPLTAIAAATPTSGHAPLTVQFKDNSTGGPTAWDWDFGDGFPHSTQQNPTHTYWAAGTYSATLTVANGVTPPSSVTVQIIVLAPTENWHVDGNTGIDSSIHFLGTTKDDDAALIIRTHGVERMHFDTAGNVGIGTTTPSAALDVKGKAQMTDFQLNKGAPNDADVLTFDHATGTGSWKPITLGGLNASDFWQLGGNSTSPGQFLGTTNDQPLELKTDGARALRLESAPSGVNVIGGIQANSVAPKISGGTIAGGGRFGSIIPGGIPFPSQGNTVNADFGTIGGGAKNVVGGPGQNPPQQSIYGTIGGGFGNTIVGNEGTIPGGDKNTAGRNSFAAGHRARAITTGTFVWADAADKDFDSSGDNQFLIRASGGVGINKNSPASALDVVGTIRATSSNNAVMGLTTGVNASDFGVVGMADTNGGTGILAMSTVHAYQCLLGTSDWAADIKGPAHFSDEIRCEGSYWWSKPGWGGYRKLDEVSDPLNVIDLAIWTTSDERLKRETATIPDALAAIKQLRGVTFYWNDKGLKYATRDIEKNSKSISGKPEDDKKLWETERKEAYAKLSKQQFGFIAQEVEKVFPNWISTDEQGYKRVNTAQLNTVLVNAVKEQQTLIEAQQKEIDELKAAQRRANTEWEARFKELQAALERSQKK